jgi:hypothetical protein
MVLQKEVWELRPMANSIAVTFRNIPTVLSTLDGQLLAFDRRRNLAGPVNAQDRAALLR